MGTARECGAKFLCPRWPTHSLTHSLTHTYTHALTLARTLARTHARTHARTVVGRAALAAFHRGEGAERALFCHRPRAYNLDQFELSHCYFFMKRIQCTRRDVFPPHVGATFVSSCVLTLNVSGNRATVHVNDPGEVPPLISSSIISARVLPF